VPQELTAEQQRKLTAAALRRYESLQRRECFDPYILDSRPTESQGKVLHDITDVPVRAVVAANQSGKSLTGGRETAWLFSDTHPTFERPVEWGTEPLLMLVMGQVGEQITSHIWAKKIKPFLDPGSFKEVRIGNILQRVENLKNGNTIIFVSHHNAEEARRTAQGYPAHYVWIDEMPRSLSLIAELMVRLQAKNGRFLLTFTPLVRSVEVQEFVENLKEPLGKRYNLMMLDNPAYAGRESEVLSRFDGLPEAERATRLTGAWYSGDNAVFDFNPQVHVTELPAEYTQHWEHVECVDPAGQGKAGYVLLAAKPESDIWYVVKSKYLDGAAATDLLDRIRVESAGYNIIRRVSDPHEVWFIKEAFKQGFSYMGVYNKKNRKMELIKGVQKALTEGSSKLVKGSADLLIKEISSCQWSDSVDDRIVNASKYHLLDAYQYGLDTLPRKRVAPRKVHSDSRVQYDIDLRESNKQRKKDEQQNQKASNTGRRKWIIRSSRYW
jgi:phage terminase large subunit-like protein